MTFVSYVNRISSYDTKVNYKNLRFQSIHDWAKDNLNVLEIKFKIEKLDQARELISKMPFIPKRHSKYLRGLSHCKMAVYIWYKILIS